MYAIVSGPEASVADLTDFICAAQMAREQDCYEDDLKVNFLLIMSLYLNIHKDSRQLIAVEYFSIDYFWRTLTEHFLPCLTEKAYLQRKQQKQKEEAS